MQQSHHPEIQKLYDDLYARNAKSVSRSVTAKFVPKEHKCGCKKLKCYSDCCNHYYKKDKNTCGCKRVLGKCLFKHGRTVTITCPGRYCLGSDVKFHANEIDAVAIVIDSNDVVLDLCGHTLKQYNLVKFATGILVAEGRSNVTILGTYGAVRDFTGFGVRVRGNTSNITIGDDTKLEVTGCGFSDYNGEITFFGGNATAGIFVGDTDSFTNTSGENGCNGVILKNLVVDRNSFIGLGLTQSTDITVTNCSFNENTLATVGPFNESFAQTLYTFHTSYEKDNKNISFTNCSFDRNRSDLPEADFYDLTVALPNGFENLSFVKCTFNDNFCVGSILAAGAASGNCATWTDCQFCGNTSDSRVEGFHISGQGFQKPVRGVQIIRCLANNNVADLGGRPAPLFGFSMGYNILYADGLEMIDCQSSYNKFLAASVEQPEDGVIGTAMFAEVVPGAELITENHIIRNLQSVGNYTNTNGFSVGFDLDLNQRRVVVEGGQFSDNKSDSGRGYGILLLNREGFPKVPSVEHVVKNAIVQNNSSVGIELRTQERCLIEGNTIISNGGEGILLSEEDGSTTKCWIRKNILQYNTDVAIRDTQNPSTNLATENQAFGNKQLGGMDNPTSQYDIDYTFGHVPEVIGSLTTGYPSLPTDSLTNYSMSQ